MKTLNELSKRAYQEIIANMPDKPLPFDDNLFGGKSKKRIVVPYENQEKDQIYSDLEELGYQVDKNTNSVVKIVKTNQGDKEVKIRIVKFLNKEIYDLYKKIPLKVMEYIGGLSGKIKTVSSTIMAIKREMEQDIESYDLKSIEKYLYLKEIVEKLDKINQDDLSIVISRAPVDVVRMSDFENIQSCHSEGGSYWYCAIKETETGGAVAFTVKTQDLKNIDLEDEEIFYDSDRDIPGIKPISRIRLRRFKHRSDGYSLAIPEIRMYGKEDDSFLNSLTKWAYESQSDKYRKAMPQLSEFILTGGSYRDNTASELFNNFFDVSRYYGDTEVEGSIESLSNQYQTECQEYLDKFEMETKHSYASFNIDYDDEEYINIYISGGITFYLNKKYRDDFANLTWKEQSSLRRSLQEISDIGIEEVLFNFGDKSIEVQVSYELNTVDHPDEFNLSLSDILREEKNYIKYYKVILSFVNSIKNLDEEETYNLFSVIEEIQDGEFENFNNIENDNSIISIDFDEKIVSLPLPFQWKNELEVHNLKETIGNIIENRIKKMIFPSQVRQLFIPGLEYSEDEQEIISYSNSFYFSFWKTKYKSDNNLMSVKFGLKFNVSDELFDGLSKEESISLYQFFKYLNRNYESIIDIIVSSVIQYLNSKKLIVFIED